mgnify:CR=1 FL=1
MLLMDMLTFFSDNYRSISIILCTLASRKDKIRQNEQRIITMGR